MTADERRGRGAELIGRRLPGVISGLLPKLRKIEALKRFSAVLPGELAGLAAAHEIKLAPAPERFGTGSAAAQLSTLFVYCASPAVAAIIEQRERQLVDELNGQLTYPLVETVRCEIAAPQKIAQQLNNLTLGPD